MKKYTIELNYNASIVVEVEGDYQNEGEALDDAIEKAENADIHEFTLNGQRESRILNIQ